MSPPLLWPLTDCATNYRPVLSSERAPQDEGQSIVRQKKGKRIWSWAPKRCSTPRRIGQLTVGHKINSTHYELQTCPLVREGAPRRRTKQLTGKEKKKKNFATGPKEVSDMRTDRPTDRRSQHQLNSSESNQQITSQKCTINYTDRTDSQTVILLISLRLERLQFLVPDISDTQVMVIGPFAINCCCSKAGLYLNDHAPRWRHLFDRNICHISKLLSFYPQAHTPSYNNTHQTHLNQSISMDFLN
jgi:hypothetical protein